MRTRCPQLFVLKSGGNFPTHSPTWSYTYMYTVWFSKKWSRLFFNESLYNLYSYCIVQLYVHLKLLVFFKTNSQQAAISLKCFWSDFQRAAEANDLAVASQPRTGERTVYRTQWVTPSLKTICSSPERSLACHTFYLSVIIPTANCPTRYLITLYYLIIRYLCATGTYPIEPTCAGAGQRSFNELYKFEFTPLWPEAQRPSFVFSVEIQAPLEIQWIAVCAKICVCVWPYKPVPS